MVTQYDNFIKTGTMSFWRKNLNSEFNIHNINEVIIRTKKYLFFPYLNKQAVLRGK